MLIIQYTRSKLALLHRANYMKIDFTRSVTKSEKSDILWQYDIVSSCIINAVFLNYIVINFVHDADKTVGHVKWRRLQPI